MNKPHVHAKMKRIPGQNKRKQDFVRLGAPCLLQTLLLRGGHIPAPPTGIVGKAKAFFRKLFS